MAKYHFTNEAVNDLTEIWNYTNDSWSERQADFYYKLLLAACDELAKNPGLGKDYHIVTKGVLGYRTGEHIIFYSIISRTEIEVIRILHGMMDLKSNV